MTPLQARKHICSQEARLETDHLLGLRTRVGMESTPHVNLWLADLEMVVAPIRGDVLLAPCQLSELQRVDGTLGWERRRG